MIPLAVEQNGGEVGRAWRSIARSPRQAREGRPASAHGGRLAVAARREPFDPKPTGHRTRACSPPRGARGYRRLVLAPPRLFLRFSRGGGAPPMPSAAMTAARSRPCSAAGSSPTRPSWAQGFARGAPARPPHAGRAEGGFADPPSAVSGDSSAWVRRST